MQWSSGPAPLFGLHRSRCSIIRSSSCAIHPHPLAFHLTSVIKAHMMNPCSEHGRPKASVGQLRDDFCDCAGAPTLARLSSSIRFKSEAGCCQGVVETDYVQVLNEFSGGERALNERAWYRYCVRDCACMRCLSGARGRAVRLPASAARRATPPRARARARSNQRSAAAAAAAARARPTTETQTSGVVTV